MRISYEDPGLEISVTKNSQAQFDIYDGELGEAEDAFDRSFNLEELNLFIKFLQEIIDLNSSQK